MATTGSQITAKQEYDLNNMNVAAQNIQLGTYLKNTYLVWDDLFFPLTTAKQGQTDKPPFDTSENAYMYPASDTTHIMYIAAQFPHSMQQGSVIHPHVHWKQTTGGSPVFKMDYTWSNLGGNISASKTYVMSDRGFVWTSGSIHNLNYNPVGISGSHITTPSSMMLIKLYRDDNAYPGSVPTYQFDIHLLKDSLGSYYEFSK